MLSAIGAIGAIAWEIIEGDRTLSAEAGKQVTYRAHHLEQTAHGSPIHGQAPTDWVTVYEIQCAPKSA